MTLALYLVGVPPKSATICCIDGLRALRAVPIREVVNPRITIGSTTLALPVTMVAGDELVLKHSGECQLVGRDGKVKPIPIRGTLPELQPGPTPVQFACDTGLSNEVRVSMTRK